MSFEISGIQTYIGSAPQIKRALPQPPQSTLQKVINSLAQSILSPGNTKKRVHIEIKDSINSNPNRNSYKRFDFACKDENEIRFYERSLYKKTTITQIKDGHEISTDLHINIESFRKRLGITKSEAASYLEENRLAEAIFTSSAPLVAENKLLIQNINALANSFRDLNNEQTFVEAVQKNVNWKAFPPELKQKIESKSDSYTSWIGRHFPNLGDPKLKRQREVIEGLGFGQACIEEIKNLAIDPGIFNTDSSLNVLQQLIENMPFIQDELHHAVRESERSINKNEKHDASNLVVESLEVSEEMQVLITDELEGLNDMLTLVFKDEDELAAVKTSLASIFESLKDEEFDKLNSQVIYFNLYLEKHDPLLSLYDEKRVFCQALVLETAGKLPEDIKKQWVIPITDNNVLDMFAGEGYENLRATMQNHYRLAEQMKDA